MADTNLTGFQAMQQRAMGIINNADTPGMAPLATRDGRQLPFIFDNQNQAATAVANKKDAIESAKKNLTNAQVNIAYDLKDDIAAADEERRYQATVAFIDWLIKSYATDAFSLHVMFEKHPFLKDMLLKAIDYWTDNVRKISFAKLLPRTMWDQDVENLLFKMYSMEPQQRTKFFEFVNSNPFITGVYPERTPYKRGPFSAKKIIEEGPLIAPLDDPNKTLAALAGFSNTFGNGSQNYMQGSYLGMLDFAKRGYQG